MLSSLGPFISLVPLNPVKLSDDSWHAVGGDMDEGRPRDNSSMANSNEEADEEEEDEKEDGGGDDDDDDDDEVASAAPWDREEALKARVTFEACRR